MLERNRTLIGSKGDRELWQVEVRQPDGVWVTLFQGRSYVVIDGHRRQTPEDHAWNDQLEGRRWLERGE